MRQSKAIRAATFRVVQQANQEFVKAFNND